MELDLREFFGAHRIIGITRRCIRHNAGRRVLNRLSIGLAAQNPDRERGEENWCCRQKSKECLIHDHVTSQTGLFRGPFLHVTARSSDACNITVRPIRVGIIVIRLSSEPDRPFMLVTNLLTKKRDGAALEADEIRFLIDGFCRGEVTDYQMSAFAMAVAIRGMDATETAVLTRAMLDSGDVLARPRDDANREPASREKPRVDKHSTGGLGDMVSLILAPLLATCDVDVPMVSGRGLGLTGGTLDKLESIEGFQTQFDAAQLEQLLADCGAFIVGATDRIAPADRRLYALRDVTGTVESIPLITASILSKKLAANLDALVMDVKVGSAAFMKTHQRAKSLAHSLVNVGAQAGLPTSALLTDMDQPLGQSVGNAIEVNESIEVLGGAGGPVRDLTIELCADLLVRVGRETSLENARATLASRIDQGMARERFEKMVAAQGGKLCGPLTLAPAHVIPAPESGYLASLDCVTLGETVVQLGGGRRQVGDPIDHRVGIRVHGRIGDFFEKSQPVMTLYCALQDATDYVVPLASAFQLQEEVVQPQPLILDHVGVPQNG